MKRENELPNPLPSRCQECAYRTRLNNAEYCIGTLYGYCMELERMAKYINPKRQ